MLSLQLACSLLLAVTGASAAPPSVERAAAPTTKKVPIDPKVYDTIIHYAGYCATAPFPCQKAPPGAAIQSYASNSTTDTQVTLFRSDALRELVLAFPGTSSIQDFLTDFTYTPVPYIGGVPCPGCKVHSGFYNAWLSIQSQAEKLVSDARTVYPEYKIVVAGHSLGGSLTSLAYAGLKAKGFNVAAGYSYGEPRTGNKAYADFIDGLAGATQMVGGTYFRTTHADDGVPQLPPQSWGFQHSRTEYWAKDGANGTATVKTTFRCFGQEAPDCNDGAGGVGINAAHVFYPGLNVVGCAA